MTNQLPSDSLPIKCKLHDSLLQHPLLRSVTYGLSIRILTMTSSYIVDPVGSHTWSMMHVLAFNTVATPFVLGVTKGFVKLRSEDTSWWHQMLRTNVGSRLAIGIVLGTGSYLAVICVAKALGWVHFPEWGWQKSSAADIGWTVLTHTANLNIAVNEEILYRGYGLYSLSQATGSPIAVTLLVAYFAWGHGSGWQVLIGQSALALATTALRFSGGSLWLPIGYHAAWNYMQTAIFGASDASPSIFPIQVDGPMLWMGRPGYPEPGLLQTFVNLSVAAGALFVWWRYRRKNPPIAHEY